MDKDNEEKVEKKPKTEDERIKEEYEKSIPTFDEASKDWVVQKLRVGDRDALIIDNWYTDKELKKVFKEFDYYTNNGLDMLIDSSNDPSTAHEPLIGSLAKTYRFYVEPNPYSVMYKYNYKYIYKEFMNMVENETLFGGYFCNTKRNSLMVNYYETGEYYKSHRDNSVITQLIWINREPKMYEGGDLILTDMGEKVECKNNRTIFFPGHYKHEITEVNMKKEWDEMKETLDEDVCYGRFSIANFFY